MQRHPAFGEIGEAQTPDLSDDKARKKGPKLRNGIVLEAKKTKEIKKDSLASKVKSHVFHPLTLCLIERKPPDG